MDNSKELPQSALVAAKHSVLPLCKRFPTISFAIPSNEPTEFNVLLFKYLNAITKSFPFYEVFVYVEHRQMAPLVRPNFPIFNFDDITNHPESPLLVADFYSWIQTAHYNKKVFFYVYDPLLLIMVDQQYKNLLNQSNTVLIARNKGHRELLLRNKFKNVSSHVCEIDHLHEIINITGESRWISQS